MAEIDDDMHAAMRIEVRQSVVRQRRLTHATGVPERLSRPRPLPTLREVDNPMMTDGLLYGDPKAKNQYLKQTVTENAMTRIGALTYIRRREPHHERAAEQFKNLYEARYGSGNPAMDPSRVQVDTSSVAHDSGMAAKIDRTHDLELAMLALGKPMRDRLVGCIVLGVRCEDQADVMPGGQPNQRQVSQCVDDTLAALDSLSIHWGYRSR